MDVCTCSLRQSDGLHFISASLKIRTILAGDGKDYLSLTDIAKYQNPKDPRFIIQNWMRTRNTVHYLGLWEELHNPHFNRVEFEAVKKEVGLNSFVMTPQKWIEATNAIGIQSKAGRYGGTYAHSDIAFKFAEYIKQGMPQAERLQALRNIARYQLKSVTSAPSTKRLEASMNPPTLPPAEH